MSSAAPTGALWAVSAADLAANLLCFFVLQFAMSETDLERFRAASAGIGRGLGIDRQEPARPQATLALPSFTARAGLSLDYLATVIGAETASGGVLAGAELTREEDRLRLTFAHAALFEAGGDALRAEAEPLLFALAGLLAGVPNRLEVKARTPAEDARDERFPSGWELSLARAAAVAERLRAGGYARPLAIGGQEIADAAEPAEAAQLDLLLGEGRAR